MTKGQIIQALGFQENWYAFLLDNGKEIKVWHELKGAANWKIGDYIEYIDYDELADDFLRRNGVLYTSHRNGRLIHEYIQENNLPISGSKRNKLTEIILGKFFDTLAKEIIEQKVRISDSTAVRKWLMERGVGDFANCDDLSSGLFHNFRLNKYKKGEIKVEQKKAIEIRNQEEIKQQEINLHYQNQITILN